MYWESASVKQKSKEGVAYFLKKSLQVILFF